MKISQITPEFVDEIPTELDPGTLYVCCRYRAVKHLCACGCGVAINIPLHPTGWTLLCDGLSVSLWPSIGNWGEKCQSHYWIRHNRIHWAPKWSRRRIDIGRRARERDLDRYFGDNFSLPPRRPLWGQALKPSTLCAWFKHFFNRSM